MITEDYVSFEVAKLLKEKGFDWDCITYYVDYEPNDVKYSMLFENNTTWEKRCYSAPTHQMACKWLREVHKIEIVIEPEGVRISNDKYFNTYTAFVYKPNKYGIIGNNPDATCLYNFKKAGTEDCNKFDTYEEAVEAAIKYVLENLI